jgi:hypothetical protein
MAIVYIDEGCEHESILVVVLIYFKISRQIILSGYLFLVINKVDAPNRYLLSDLT